MALLGCIADDFAGATDLACQLVSHGMRAVVLPGLPRGPLPEAEALVIALDSRTAPAAEAVAESLAACEALLGAGARQIFFHYAPTFDSTERGNIGPVADALTKRLGASLAVFCPAFPAKGRTLYLGHLFVGQALLNESGMESHPLTPMRDANVLRLLGRQTDNAAALVPFPVIQQGAGMIRGTLSRLAETGRRHAVLDAVSDADLYAIGEAVARYPLVTGSAGLAMGLPENFRREGLLPAREDAGALPPRQGLMAVLAGSCSRATLAQIGFARANDVPVFELDALATPDARALADAALAWLDEGRLSAERPVIIAASAPPEKVAALQARLGREAAGALMARALAAIAEGLFHRGLGQLVLAGGETAEGIVAHLGISALRMGDQIDFGAPWTFAEPLGIHLALKSGNAGGRDFFLHAFG